jgi:hypothetical protein
LRVAPAHKRHHTGKKRIASPQGVLHSRKSSTVKSVWEKDELGAASILAFQPPDLRGDGSCNRAAGAEIRRIGRALAVMIRPSLNCAEAAAVSPDERTSVTRCASLPGAPWRGASPVKAEAPESRSQPPMSEVCRRFRLDCVNAQMADGGNVQWRMEAGRR